MVSRGCWAGATPTVFQLIIQGASLLVLPRIWESQWCSQAEGFYQKADRQLKGPDAYGPGLFGPGWPPLGRVSVYTASHSARLFSVPLGDRSANPATDGASGRSSLL